MVCTLHDAPSMKPTTIAVLASIVVFSACGMTKSVRLDTIEAARRSDDFVTVKVTTVSNGHIALEPDDEFCVKAAWSTLAAPDGGENTDAGASDAGASDGGADAGVLLIPGTELDSVSGCSTVRNGFVITLTSTKAIPKQAVLEVSLTKGFGLGTITDGDRVMLSP